jgi:two-component system NtrC family sensor kinase
MEAIRMKPNHVTTVSRRRYAAGHVSSSVEGMTTETLFETLANKSPVGVYIVQDGKFCYVNPSFQRFTGYSKDELLGWDSLELVFPDDREVVRENAVKMLKGELDSPYQFRVIHKTGSIRWVMESVSSIQYGERRATLGSYMDITERKQTEEALRESEERYKALFDSTIAGTLVIDAETKKVVLGNQVAAKMLGFNLAEETIGINLVDFIPLNDKEKVLKIIVKDIFEQDLRQVNEFQIVTKDGREIWINAVGARIELEGKPAVLVSCVDITEHKRQRGRQMMIDRLSSIGELVAGTAHELNNPLTSIIGFSQLLMEKDIPDDIREDLEFIYNEAHRTAEVVKNLLTFAGKHTPMKQLVQINNIIDDVLKLRDYELRIDSIEVKKRLAPDLPEIMVDDFQMQQVFINIIINAEYFMTEAHKRGTLTITTKKQNENVMISIADDGPGILEGNLRRIFDPFFTTKPAGKGTGLGLSICHGIVAEHGGQIYAKSQQGKGATFFIELPINGT